MPKLDLIGKSFGMLTVRTELGRTYYGHVVWLCDCKCGAICTPTTENLRSGNTKSCGCVAASKSLQKRMRGSLYKTWLRMMARCGNPSDHAYTNYGGRGITVCEQWKNFDQFDSDMSPRPDGMTLDRINNDGPYSPENCRWATKKAQGNNRRTNVRYRYGDENLTATEWAEKTGVGAKTIAKRLKDGIGFPFAILNIDYRAERIRGTS